MNRVLLTGANGFTGKHLTACLKSKGITVIAPDFDITNKEEVTQSIQELNSSISIDWVIHLAAISYVGHKDYKAFYEVNVIGTENLLSSLSLLKKKPKVLIASSANVYGNSDFKGGLNENLCPNPTNHYACSKLAMELIAKQFLNKLQIVITRPFNYTGPDQGLSFLVPKVVSHFKNKKKTIELGNIEVFRDFCSVEDVIKAYWKIISTDIGVVNGEVINICSGKATSLMQIVRYLEELAGYQIEIQVNSEFVRKNEIKVLYGSNQKLKDLTGFSPNQNGLFEAIRTMYLVDPP